MSIGMTAVVGAGEPAFRPDCGCNTLNGLPEYDVDMTSAKDEQSALHRLSNMLKVYNT